MIQDIDPMSLRNEYLPDRKVTPDRRVFFFSEKDGVLLKKAEEIVLPTKREAEEYLGKEAEWTYLFHIEGEDYFLSFEKQIEKKEDSLLEFVPLSDIRRRKMGPKHLRYAYYTAKHLYDWYRTTQYCGCCKGAMLHSNRERAMRCSVCGYTAYPRIMPAVIVGVRNGESLLLTKYRTGFRENALVAGFVEIGETVEETVCREVMEEAGLKVKNIQYYKSQPWGMANDILMGFYCDVDGDTTIHMDEQELKYAQWVPREEIVLQSMDDSLTNEMMKMFREGRDRKGN